MKFNDLKIRIYAPFFVAVIREKGVFFPTFLETK
jgi:hypothetical protein